MEQEKNPSNAAGTSSDQDKIDEELSKLLDSSLQEFGKSTMHTPEKPPVKVDMDSLGAAPAFDKETAEKAAADFKNMIKQISEMQQVMLKKVHMSTSENVGEAAASHDVSGGAAGTADASEEAQLCQAFLQNLNMLAGRAQEMKDAGNEDELENAMHQLQNDSDYENEFLPFMQGLMSSLLSKETLYPSLKEMADKYPPWLDANRGKTEPAELERFEAQLRLIQEACKEFEEEKDDDPDDVKGQRFERLIMVMQKMQACGQPPEDLVGALPPGWAVDEATGMPQVVDQGKAAEACSIM